MNTDQLQSYHAQQIKEYRNESNNEIDKITDEFDKLERENDSLKSLLKEGN